MKMVHQMMNIIKGNFLFLLLVLNRRYSKQNVMSEVPGPTIYAKKFVKAKNILSIWSLFLDRIFLQQIKECTETEAKCVLQSDNLTVITDELQAFIGNL